MSQVNNRLLRLADATKLMDFYLSNEAFLQPWEPKRPPHYNQKNYWLEQLAYRERLQIEKNAAFWVSENIETGQIVAQCSLTCILYGCFQSAFMGFSVDQDYQGRGVMRSLCQDTIRYAFEELNLRRINANHMPNNTRSEGLLNSLGFEREGYAREYLNINGKWEDHVLNALIRS